MRRNRHLREERQPAVSSNITTASSYDDWGEETQLGQQRKAAQSEAATILAGHAAADGSVPAASVPDLTRDLANLIDQIAEKAWSNGARSGFEEGSLGEDL
jgi:hypothetical protein